MRMVYSEALIDHFERPRHVGQMDGVAADVGSGEAGTRETGGVLRVQIRVDPDDLITEACFKAYGSPALIAVGSWLVEAVLGSSLARAESLDHQSIADALALPPARLHCAMQAQDVIRAAIQDYRDKQRAYA